MPGPTNTLRDRAVPIAMRNLKIETSTGTIDVPVTIDAPQPDDRSWRCVYAIGWPELRWESAAYGVDAVQALDLAMRKIATELYMSQYHEAGTLRWERPGGGYGFPILKVSRDLLVGDDKEFDG